MFYQMRVGYNGSQLLNAMRIVMGRLGWNDWQIMVKKHSLRFNSSTSGISESILKIATHSQTLSVPWLPDVKNDVNTPKIHFIQ